jgi:hypothetical protein
MKINLRNADFEKHGYWRLNEHTIDSYGYYVNGQKHGYWVYQSTECADYSIGHYVNGEQIGYWEHKLSKTIPPKINKQFFII